MELLAEISDADFGLKPRKVTRWRVRRAARTVLIDENGEIVLEHARKLNYYKIPGGGIERSESVIKAARREALEETGYKIKIIKPIGLIREYRSRIKLLQISYCFLASTVGYQEEPNFTGSEKSEGFTTSNAKDLNHAILLVKQKGKDLPYLAKFMVKRDSLFLEKAKSVKA
jgi:8-oxo-dGTP diphosphatase